MTEICGNCGHPYGYHKASASKAGPRDMCPPKKKSQDDYSWHQNWDESSGTLFFGTRLQMPKERYRAIIKFLVENGLDA